VTAAPRAVLTPFLTIKTEECCVVGLIPVAVVEDRFHRLEYNLFVHLDHPQPICIEQALEDLNGHEHVAVG
jgi:hypothetical protein